MANVLAKYVTNPPNRKRGTFTTPPAEYKTHYSLVTVLFLDKYQGLFQFLDVQLSLSATYLFWYSLLPQ